MKDDVLVIGCGASGMAAAISAAERGASVRILEKKEQAGKKILLTGNGKCNFSNFYLTERNYRGHNASFVTPILHRVHTEALITFFESIGMLAVSDEARLYPATKRAETVVSVLLRRLKALGVSIEFGKNVEEVKEEDGSFKVIADGETYEARTVILSSGSPASVRDPRAFTAYEIAESLGHHVYRVLPALTDLHGNESLEELWAGVRVQGEIRFRERRESGELQLTKNGVSGIPAFSVSRFVSEALSNSEKATVFLNFLPQYDPEALMDFLKKDAEKQPDVPLFEYLSGWIPKKLVSAVSKKSRVSLKRTLGELRESEKRETVELLQSFPYRVLETGDFSASQAACGGIDTSEVREDLSSRLVPGLFITGEALDIDGECGGYNLHFAFASGLIAGESAALFVRERSDS